MKVQRFVVPEHLDPDALIADLVGDLAVEPRKSRSLRTRFFDSFDWRLHRADCALARQDGEWRLLGLADGKLLASAATWAGSWPRFANDFPAASDLRGRLEDLLGVRALIHLVTATGQQRRWRLRDDDRKVVLRIVLTDLNGQKPASETRVRWLDVEPVRGCGEIPRQVRRAGRKLGLQAAGGLPLDDLLTTVGIQPRVYGERFAIALAADMTASEAFVRISQRLLQSIRQNESGLRADIDTEFLHDFRVAVRRQRSALALFKGTIDPDAASRFATEFAALGQVTGSLRDLDVDLLDRDHYRNLLPDELSDGLTQRFERLAAKRAVELARVRRVLSSAEYRRLVVDWAALLDDPPPGPRAAESLARMAQRRLRKRHRRVLRDGSVIARQPSDEHLHRLRIECKKLRYLLEFTASIFPDGDARELVRHLKELQDVLGEINDLRIQRIDLAQVLTDLPGPDQLQVPEAGASGGLIAVLTARRAEVQRDFETAYARFASRAVTRKFRRLYHKSSTAG